MANIICFKQEKGLKNCSNRQLKVTAKHKIYPDGQKNAHLENRRGVGHCPMCSPIRVEEFILSKSPASLSGAFPIEW